MSDCSAGGNPNAVSLVSMPLRGLLLGEDGGVGLSEK